MRFNSIGTVERVLLISQYLYAFYFSVNFWNCQDLFKKILKYFGVSYLKGTPFIQNNITYSFLLIYTHLQYPANNPQLCYHHYCINFLHFDILQFYLKLITKYNMITAKDNSF